MIIFQKLVIWPSKQTLKQSVQNNQIRNCTITTDNISKVKFIYGPQIHIIKCKAIIRNLDHHQTTPRIPFPDIMAKHHQDVELAIDFLFFNGSPLLQTKSRKIDFRSVQAFSSSGKSETISVLKQVNTK